MDVVEIPDDLVRRAADIVLGFAKDLTNADAMIDAVAEALAAEREKGEEFKAQAYQVIGMLLDKAGVHDSDEGIRALDYFAYAETPNEDFLPWPIDQTYSNPAYVPVKGDE